MHPHPSTLALFSLILIIAFVKQQPGHAQLSIKKIHTLQFANPPHGAGLGAFDGAFVGIGVGDIEGLGADGLLVGSPDGKGEGADEGADEGGMLPS